MADEYTYSGKVISPGHQWIDPVILKIVDRLVPRRVLDLGCGNGVLARKIADRGYHVIGIEHSESAVAEAREMFPGVDFRVCGVYEDPKAADLGTFDLVVSEEVVEHLYYPDELLKFAAKVLSPGGRLIISTPYYGYLRNILLAVCNRWDHHLTPLWTHGHIKLFSRATMRKLLGRNGFQMDEFHGAGNFAFFWRTMVVVASTKSEPR
jgi:2-polyprenyl-3-methyl-5-hydroxy-6-metoxy-1,4-benzoquinol methylase